MDIIAAIDSATGCHHCGSALGNSPSDDFCSQDCQQAWSAARTVPLVGYRERYGFSPADYESPSVPPLLRIPAGSEAYIGLNGGTWLRFGETAADFIVAPEPAVHLSDLERPETLDPEAWSFLSDLMDRFFDGRPPRAINPRSTR